MLAPPFRGGGGAGPSLEAIVDTCDWCGNPGHIPSDHPLPEVHEYHDPELDNPLMVLALNDFIDWQERAGAAGKPRTPIQAILGEGPDVRCNELVHWWPTGVGAGDSCLCGQRQRAGEVST